MPNGNGPNGGLAKYISFDRLLLLAVIVFQVGGLIKGTEVSGAVHSDRIGVLEVRVREIEGLWANIAQQTAASKEWQEQVIERLRAIEAEVRRRP